MSAVSKTFFAALVSTVAHHDAVGVQGVKLRMDQFIQDQPEDFNPLEVAKEAEGSGETMEFEETKLAQISHYIAATELSEHTGRNMIEETLELYLDAELRKYHVDSELKSWNFADKKMIYCRIQYVVAELQEAELFEEGMTFQELEEELAGLNDLPPLSLVHQDGNQLEE